MLLNGINFCATPKFSSIQKSGISFQGNPIHQDCFVKTIKPEEKAQSKEAQNEETFLDWAEETNFFEDGFVDAMKPENYIGKGFTHTVYNIPGNDKYVLRVYNDDKKYLSKIDPDSLEIKCTQDKNLTRNYGQVLYQIKGACEDGHYFAAEIMLKQNGTENGNPPASTLYNEITGKLIEGEKHYDDMARKEKFAKTLEILAKMPQSSYNDLMEQIIELNSAGYRFDFYNPNNFLLDEDNQKINIVDLEKASGSCENNLGCVLWALLDTGYFPTYVSKVPEDEPNYIEDDKKDAAFDNTLTVMDKYMTAMKKYDLKFKEEGREFYEVLDSMPMSFYIRSMNREDKMCVLKRRYLI